MESRRVRRQAAMLGFYSQDPCPYLKKELPGDSGRIESECPMVRYRCRGEKNVDKGPYRRFALSIHVQLSLVARQSQNGAQQYELHRDHGRDGKKDVWERRCHE